MMNAASVMAPDITSMDVVIQTSRIVMKYVVEVVRLMIMVLNV
jgi:hypothetical protein